ncbi:MAG: hypothetical protein ABJF88_17805 [Rhodothermales bacterium]
MIDPTTVVAIAQTALEMAPPAIEAFKAARSALGDPVRKAMVQAEDAVKQRMARWPRVDIDLAVSTLNATEAPWVLAYMVWNGHEVDLQKTAARWADIAGTSLGIGETRLDAAHELATTYVATFRRAAAEGPSGLAFHEAQSERRQRQSEVVAQRQTETLQAHGEGQTQILLDAIHNVGRDVATRYEDRVRAVRQRLTTAVDALNALELRSAVQETESILDELDAHRETDPQSEGAFVGLRQTALAIKGQAAVLLGDIPAQRDVIAALRVGGSIVDEAVKPVVLLAADAGAPELLRELVPRLPKKDSERPFLDVVVEAMGDDGRLDPEAVLRCTTSEEGGVNLLALRVDALINAVTPERAIEAAELLNALDEAEGSESDPLLPRKGLLVGQKTFYLLRRVTEERLETPGLDRERLVDETRRRLGQAADDLAGLGDEYLGGLLEALVETVNFLTFVEEFDAAEDIHARVRALQPPGGPIGAIERRDVTTPEQIAQLEAQEVVKPSHKSIMEAHQSLTDGRGTQARRQFGAALEAASTVGEREMALGDYVYSLLRESPPRIEEAEELLEEEQDRNTESVCARPDWIGSLSVRVANARGGASAALIESNTQLDEFPRSLLLLRQRRDLLIREIADEKGRRDTGEAVTGRRKIHLAEEIEQTAVAMHRLLPAPAYLVDAGRSWAERGQWKRAWELLSRAVGRGIQDKGVREEVERYRRTRSTRTA